MPLFSLLVSLIPSMMGCRQERGIDLRQDAKTLWIYDGKNVLSAPPESVDAWQLLSPESFDDKPVNPDARAFFSFSMDEDPALHYLVLTKCTNVIRIFQDQQLILEKNPHITYPRSVSILAGEPFAIMPSATRPSRIILETFYSEKSGYFPTCHTMSLTDQETALYKLSTMEFGDLAAGAIVLFMSIASIMLFFVKRMKLLLYFSLSIITMSSTYVLGSDLFFMLFAHGSEWQLLWHTLLTFSLIPFFLFIEIIIPSPSKIALRLAQFNLIVFLVIFLAYFWDRGLNYELIKRNYYKILILEFLVFLPFAIKSIFQKSPFAQRLGFSLVLLSLAAAHDISVLLFVNASQFMMLPWALIGFITILLSIAIQKTIQHEATLQRAKAKLIADRNSKLQSEVDRRTSDLNRRNAELERIHIELEDHHEILANQKEKVAAIARDKDALLSRIADLRNQSIPKIFDCLQALHLAFDKNSFEVLSSHINLLAKTLEPAARQYEKSHSMSKKRLLILDADRKHQRIYRMAIGGSKMEMKLAENLEEFAKLLQIEAFDLVALHLSWLGVAGEILKASSPGTIVLFSSEDTLKNLALLRQNPSIAHIIPLYLPRSVLQQMLLIHLSKLLTSDIFGIEKYLAWGFDVKERPLPTAEQSDFLVRHIREDLEKMGLEADGIDSMAEITSCLLSIKKAHALVSNWSPHTISAPLQQLRYGFDASLVALSMDLRGRLLSQQELIIFLERHMQESEAGSTLPSLSRLLQLADAMIINSDGDKRHELIILIFLEKTSPTHQPAAYFHFEAH